MEVVWRGFHCYIQVEGEYALQAAVSGEYFLEKGLAEFNSTVF